MASDPKKSYDVFLSHNIGDKPAVEALAQKLLDAGLTPFLDKWHLVPGEPWQEALEEALTESSACTVFLGPGGIGPWENEEMRSALALRVRDRAFRVIPALLPKATIPESEKLPLFLQRLTWVDFRPGLEDEESLRRLIAGIRGLPPGASSPSQEPTGCRYWNVPHRRNPFFTGREDVLENLHTALQAQGSAALGQAISGLGGIGKTQTAVEYAYRHQDDYNAVLWTRAQLETELAAGFTEVARILDLHEKDAKEQEVVVEAVKRWLESHAGWLLVLDNADSPEIVEPFLPKPRRARGRLLVTSRARDFSVLDIPQSLRLETLPPEDALSMLLKRTRRQEASVEERSTAAEIARELGFLPLALEQAAAYMAAMETRFADYLRSFLDRRMELLEKGKPRQDHPESVATTWAMNFEEVEAASAASADILRLSAFLAPDRIPLEVLIEGSEDLGTSLSQALHNAGEDRLVLDELLEVLSRFSLLERDVEAGTFDVHRMVQAVVRDAIDEEDERLWVERSVKALDRAYPEVEFDHWPWCDRLQPHVIAVDREIGELSLSFEAAGRLLNQAGLYAWRRALYSEAEPLHQRARAIYEQTRGPDHPEFAKTLNNLALLYSDQGRGAEAEPLYQRALAIYEESLGPDHPSLAKTLNNLALLYRAQGRYAEAEPLHQRALAIYEALGPDHSKLAATLHNLAVLYRAQDRDAEAEPLYQRSLAIMEQTLGPNHPSLATTLNNLANLYRAKGRDAEAEPLYQRALAIKEQALGPEHPLFASTMGNLALLFRDQGRDAEAEPLYQRALAIEEQALGPEHPSLAKTLHNLANLYRDQGRDAEAEPLYRRALAIKEQALGSGHPSLATTLENYSTLLRQRGRPKEAEAMEARARVIWAKRQGSASDSGT